MKKKLISLIVCIAVLGALLGAYYYAQTAKNSEEPEATPEPTETITYDLIDREVADIAQLTIKRGDGEFSYTQDAEGNWAHVGQFVNLKQVSLKAMAADFTGAYITKKVEGIDKTNFAEYGLSPAKVTVTGTYTDGKSDTLLIGDLAPTQDYYYACMKGDDTVYLLRKYTGEKYLQTYNDLVDKTMNPVIAENLIDASIIRKDKKPITLIPDLKIAAELGVKEPYASTTGLVMTSPLLNKTVYAENFSSMLLEPAMAIKLGDLVDLDNSNLAKYGLDDPRLDMVFDAYIAPAAEGQPSSVERYHLTVGGTDETGDNVYCMYEGNPHIFKIPVTSITEIENANPFRFVDKFVSLMPIVKVKNVTLEVDGKKYDMLLNHTFTPSEQEGAAPTDVMAPTVNGQSVQYEAFRSFYQVLIGMLYDSEIEPVKPTGTPEIRVTYYMLDGTGPFVDEYYDYDSTFYCIVQNGADAQFVISKQYTAQVSKYIEDLIAGKLDQ